MFFRKSLIMTLSIVSATAASTTFSQEVLDNDGNRYNKLGVYHSEVSAAKAFLDVKRKKAVLVDVRTLREYAAGHPWKAYNVPYPRIDRWTLPDDSQYTIEQDPGVFYWEVFNIVNGKTDTPVYTLCRTGSRSVDAGNILADPENFGVPGGIPFTKVRNIWEGFVGQLKYAYDGGDIVNPPVPLDLNHNDQLDEDTSDVYAHTADKNPDKDGWRNFQQLPWTTKTYRPLSYQQDLRQYECWQTNDGCEPPEGY